LGDDQERGVQQQETPARRSRWWWRVLAIVALIVFATWTIATIVSILAEGTPSKRTATDGGKPALGSGQVTIAAAGDIGSSKAGNATVDEMAKSKPDVYLALGNLSYGGPASETRWCELVRSKIGPVAPFEIVAGTREADAGEDSRIANYVACLPDRLNAVGEYGRQYYFDLGRLARVIMISPNLIIDGVHYSYVNGSANTQWLTDAINGARTAGIRWVVVGIHNNCISVGEYPCQVNQELLSLLIEKRVDLVLSGHDRTYQRSKQLAAPSDGCSMVVIDSFDRDCVVDGSDTVRQGAGTVFVVSGAGGEELSEVHADDPEAGYFDVMMGANRQGRHGFSSLSLAPSKLSVTFIGSTRGSFSDNFEVTAAPASHNAR
jgi:hypothetical protein